MIYQEYVKRGFDFIVAAAGLVVVCVPVALAMVTIWLSSPGPVFLCRLALGDRDDGLQFLNYAP